MTLFFTVVGYNMKIFLNDRELVSGYQFGGTVYVLLMISRDTSKK